MASEQSWDLNSSLFFFLLVCLCVVHVFVRTCTHVFECARVCSRTCMYECVLVCVHAAQVEIREQPWVLVPRHLFQDLLVCKFATQARLAGL